jgi:hypothetical protein
MPEQDTTTLNQGTTQMLPSDAQPDTTINNTCGAGKVEK